MSWQHVHTSQIAIRWGDMDAMGHVNNTVYFRYIEQARIDWMEAQDCMPNPLGHGPVIINAHCSFIKQLKYPGTIEVKTFIGKPGRTSFETLHEIRLLGEDGVALPTIHAQGGAKVVWVDFQAEKSQALPERLLAMFNQS
ncbi:MAG: acyl-CoA thioesterase [Burkholderiales bacterium]|nr:acyl-CoA thioesterase [Burkholderiales bacterium]